MLDALPLGVSHSPGADIQDNLAKARKLCIRSGTLKGRRVMRRQSHNYQALTNVRPKIYSLYLSLEKTMRFLSPPCTELG